MCNIMFIIEEIEKHKNYPFLDIRDIEQYLMAQKYWLALLKSVLSQNISQWQFWLPQDPELEGSAIISIRDLAHERGIIIDQQCVAADREKYGQEYRPLVVFLGTWEDEEDSHIMPYLKIFSRISEETRKQADWLLRHWIDTTTTTDEMNKIIDEYYEKT